MELFMKKNKYENESPRARKKRLRRKKIIRRRIFAVLILLLFVLIAGIVLFIMDKLNKINYKDVDRDNLYTVDLDLEDYYNVLVFGVDSRADELEKNTRSDTMILVSINTKTKEIKLTSFYRDTYVQIDGHDYNKLGHAYSYGGATLALSTFNKNFDLDLDTYVTVNFTSVANAINMLGGVEVEVKEAEIPHINKYGGEIARINGCKYTNVTTHGKITLDGYQAIGYSRIRKLGNGDFERTNRQRAVLNAMFAKLKKSDLSTINDMLDEILPQVLTNMDNKTILALAKDCLSYEITESTGFPYNLKTGYVGKAAMVLPNTLHDNVIELHNRLFKSETGTDYIPTSTVEEISTHISQYIKK